MGAHIIGDLGSALIREQDWREPPLRLHTYDLNNLNRLLLVIFLLALWTTHKWFAQQKPGGDHL